MSPSRLLAVLQMKQKSVPMPNWTVWWFYTFSSLGVMTYKCIRGLGHHCFSNGLLSCSKILFETQCWYCNGWKWTASYLFNVFINLNLLMPGGVCMVSESIFHLFRQWLVICIVCNMAAILFRSHCVNNPVSSARTWNLFHDPVQSLHTAISVCIVVILFSKFSNYF